MGFRLVSKLVTLNVVITADVCYLSGNCLSCSNQLEPSLQ